LKHFKCFNLLQGVLTENHSSVRNRENNLIHGAYMIQKIFILFAVFSFNVFAKNDYTKDQYLVAASIATNSSSFAVNLEVNPKIEFIKEYGIVEVVFQSQTEDCSITVSFFEGSLKHNYVQFTCN
jgi:hypothetical protein